VFSDGVFQVNFGWLNDDESTPKFRKKLKDTLTEKAQLSSPPDYEEKYVTFQKDEWIEKVAYIIDALAISIEKASNKADAGDA